MNTLHGIRPRSMVSFLVPNGLALNGKPEFKKAKGRVVMVFPDRLVVNMGERYGRSFVVTDDNILFCKA